MNSWLFHDYSSNLCSYRESKSISIGAIYGCGHAATFTYSGLHHSSTYEAKAADTSFTQNTFSATQPAGAGSNTSSLDAPSEPTNVTNGLSPIVSNQLPNTLANNHNLSPLPQQVQQAISSMTSAGSRLEAPQAATNSTTQYPPGVPLPGNADRERSASGSSTQQQITRNMLPGSLGDLVQSFDQVKSKGIAFSNFTYNHALMFGQPIQLRSA